MSSNRFPRRHHVRGLRPSTIHTLEPDFSPVHKLATRAIPWLASTQTFLAERAASSHAAERDSIGNVSHHAGCLVDQPVNTIADLGLAAATAHHFITDAQATIRHLGIKRLSNLFSRFYAHEL